MRRSGVPRNRRLRRTSSPSTIEQSCTRRSGRSRCGFWFSSTASPTCISQGCAGCFEYHFRVSATGRRSAPESRHANARHYRRCPAKKRNLRSTEVGRPNAVEAKKEVRVGLWFGPLQWGEAACFVGFRGFDTIAWFAGALVRWPKRGSPDLPVSRNFQI